MECIHGTIVRGVGEGRTLGYPTANLDTEPQHFETGIYTGYTKFHGASLKLPTAVIIRPLEHKKRIEAHILDWTKDMYDTQISVCIIEKIRDWHTFPTKKLLQEQIEKDLQTIRARLNEFM